MLRKIKLCSWMKRLIQFLMVIPTIVGCLFICTFFFIVLKNPHGIENGQTKRSATRIQTQNSKQVSQKTIFQKHGNATSVLRHENVSKAMVNPTTGPNVLVSNLPKDEKTVSTSETNYMNSTTENVIYEHPFTYLHVPIDTCISSGAKEDPFLLVVVKSDVTHLAHRMAIRSTWGVTAKPGLKVVFLLGYSELMKTYVQMESNLHKDIIQENFLDDYRNNTMKTIMGFEWVASHCSGAKYIYFVDDDYLVNIKYIWDHLHRLYNQGQKSVFIGFVWRDAKPQRQQTSKWYIPKDVFIDDTWPPYASGGSIVVTVDLIMKINTMFKRVKPIFIDDVYLGIICKKLGIELTHEPRFYYGYLPSRMGYLFSTHGFSSPKGLMEDWARYHKKLDMVI